MARIDSTQPNSTPKSHPISVFFLREENQSQNSNHQVHETTKLKGDKIKTGILPKRKTLGTNIKINRKKAKQQNEMFFSRGKGMGNMIKKKCFTENRKKKSVLQ